ncbi:MAG: sulfate transporter CysZ [Gammaproteobacteria bacterium]|nr:sulfate transporter CysZ [Gammaproteobacteria bacterium]
MKRSLNESVNPTAGERESVGLLKGMGYLLEGFRILRKPGLKRYLLLPLAINVLVFALLAWVGIDQSGAFFDRFLPQNGWLSYIRWILWPLFVLAYLLILFYSFTILANLIGAPFNGLLAAKVERSLTGEIPSQAPGHWAADIIPGILSELRKLLYFLVRAIPLLLLFLIPGVQLAAPLLWALFAAWFLALEYMDYPMSNHGMAFGSQLRQLKRRRLAALGFGGGITLMMLIPVINLAVMPAAVAGATAFWCNNRKALEDR